ncbi:MAG TPA: alginate export family protein, partial [Longimicrobiales bacterium]|nr:alginate export family protein [Longimicrobiales bacterium]
LPALRPVRGAAGGEPRAQGLARPLRQRRGHRALAAEITGYQFWRAERRSGHFDATGRRLRAGDLASSREVGAEIDALVRWQLDPHTVVAVGYSRVFPGRFIRRSGPSESIDFGYLIAQYTF